MPGTWKPPPPTGPVPTVLESISAHIEGTSAGVEVPVHRHGAADADADRLELRVRDRVRRGAVVLHEEVRLAAALEVDLDRVAGHPRRPAVAVDEVVRDRHGVRVRSARVGVA